MIDSITDWAADWDETTYFHLILIKVFVHCVVVGWVALAVLLVLLLTLFVVLSPIIILIGLS